MKRCKRCVMPETWPGITFDKGVCSLCKAYDEEQKIDWGKRHDELLEIFARYKAMAIVSGKKYNVLCGFSGGKDTSFTLAVLVREYGMTPLCFTFAHGFPLTPEGEWNLTEFPKVLGVDHLGFTMGNKLRNAMCKKGCELIGDFCLACHRGVGAMPAHISKMFGIELQVWGERTSAYSTTGNYRTGDVEEQDEAHFNDAFYGNVKDIAPKGFNKKDVWMLAWPKGRFALKPIYLGSYIRWRQVEQVEYIKKLGWKCPPATEENPWPFNKLDCEFEVNRNFQKHMKRGFDHVSFRASIDIREGRLTRGQGLALVAMLEGRKPKNMTNFFQEIQMTEKEFIRLTLAHKVV